MKRARDDVEIADLLLHQLDEARMGMTVTDRRIRAHHVEITFAGIVPHEHRLAAGQDNRKRMVITRAVTRLELDTFTHDCYLVIAC